VTTCGYNDAMKRLLPLYGIDAIEVKRKETTDGAISASRVRELLKVNDFFPLVKYVPASTMAYLNSSAAAPVLGKLRESMERH
jgi:[citrate (pro-3S)-lyase] ligase